MGADMNEHFDLIIIGSGPGGYVAAIKASQLGKKTAIIENRELGGTCLNRGCIPTKTFMHSSRLFYEARNLQEAGIEIDGLRLDMNRIQERKEEIVFRIRKGIKSLLDANKITVIPGTATIMDSHRVRVIKNWAEEQDTEQEPRELSGDNILIATGSKPFLPPIEGIEQEHIVTSDQLLSTNELPYHKLLIIGGGVIGVEFASIYQEFGCQVEIIEAMDRILPSMDKEISQSVAMSLKKKGVKIHAKSVVKKISKRDQLLCEYEDSTGVHLTQAEGILVAVGRKANTEGLFQPDFSLEMEGDKIKVNENFETSKEHIYAIGDVIKGVQLAHAASAQGIRAVENMYGVKQSIELSAIPSCIYTNPEIASVGLTEEEAKEKGYIVKTGKYQMLGNSKTVLSADERGYIKVVCDSSNNKILGAQIICTRATDMIGEFTTAIVNGLTTEDLGRVIRPHPTYGEAITEAIEDVDNMAIHVMPKGKKQI
ncbi:MAG: dihydrolipoyl dehydrogenase [Anaerocolumna aminovalerica]|uniref:dihydrolipoyl dehydrogenase n=1 Tax=Anaerocolumna aminovalerica TaxID=1527 RepID=UPI002912444B|nr:dihydrolipoyl dehydrogenase [Anaerocolumna aminovalerica]MDU6264296.1 dihydrolipoyl dehydrogenase [Anaerocolumna aminovalerica]